MGFDYYDLIHDSPGSLYYCKTLEILEKYPLDKRSGFVRLIKNMIFDCCLSKRKVLKIIKSFSPVLEVEYEIIASKFGDKMLEYVDLNYGAVSEIISRDDDCFFKGKDILFGNSASLTNNHLDAFYILDKCDLSNRKLICPLSYGDNRYGDYIENYGNNKFGNSFFAIWDYLSYDDYVSVLQRCSVVFMNHKRQQACGNVVISLYLWPKVYLNWENPLYHHYVRIGVKVFLIQDVIDSLM